MTTPDLSRMMVLSVHPRHVERILEGTKTVELRRTRPLIEPGQAAVMYAPVPRGALVATCRISRVETGSPRHLWETVRSLAQVARADLDQYFRYSSQAVAMHLSEVQPLRDHVTLGQCDPKPSSTRHRLGSSSTNHTCGVCSEVTLQPKRSQHSSAADGQGGQSRMRKPSDPVEIPRRDATYHCRPNCGSGGNTPPVPPRAPGDLP